jgi:uncharacterized membrane protein
MIKMNKNSKFFLSVIFFLYFLNLVLTFQIPVIFQISGIVALCLVPGYLLCLLFNIRVTDPYENFLYSVGLSFCFDLFFGIMVNTILPVFGNNTPLAPLNLQIAYSVIIIVLTLLILYTGHVPSNTFQPLKISRIEKIFLIFGLLISIGFMTGIYLVNMDSTNLVLIFSILAIPLLLFFCIIYYDDNLKRVFPFIIFLFGILIMMILALRSNYLLGVDVHEEYFLFLTTLTNSIWIPDPYLLLSSALSISILPTVFENFLLLDPQILFKLLYIFLFTVTPLIIYTTIKKYYSELLALFAACFFMFVRQFISTSGNARTSVAIVFFAFIVMIICNSELAKEKKYALLFLFLAAGVFSHYSSSYVFLFILTLAYLMDRVLTRKTDPKENRFINLPALIFFISIIFFWYNQIITTVFRTGLEFTVFRANILNDWLKNDLNSYSPTATMTTVVPPTLLTKYVYYSQDLLY